MDVGGTEPEHDVGKALAHISRGRGADAKARRRRHQPDASWTQDLGGVRDLLEVESRH